MRKPGNMIHPMMGSLSIVCGLVVWFLEPSIVRSAAGLALGVFLPGYCLVRLVLGRRGRDWLEELVLGVAASVAIVILVFFALGHCGVTATGKVVALILALITVISSIPGIRGGSPARTWLSDQGTSSLWEGGSSSGREAMSDREAMSAFFPSPRRGEGRVSGKDAEDFRGKRLVVVGLVVLIVLASFYRFAFLGYSDYQGDEAKVVLKVQRLLAGEHEVIYEHRKGPGEIYVTAASAALGGRMNELETRLPFAVASLAAVMGLYLIGRMMLGPRAGLFSGIAAAVNGYFIALSRITQYQSIVLLLLVVSFYCLYRMVKCDERRPAERYLAVGAFLLAAAFLTHYEVIISVPVFLVLLAAGLKRRPREMRPRLTVAALAVLGVAGISASFYVPFRLSPHWGTFWYYLSGARLGEPQLHDNLREFVLAGSMYTSLYYLVLTGAAVIFLCLYQLFAARRLRGFIGFALLLVAAAIFAEGARHAGPRRDYMQFAATVLFLGVLVSAPDISGDVRLLLFFASLHVVVLAFFIDRPGTHWYLAFMGLTVLSGAAVSELSRLMGRLRLLRAHVARVAGTLAAASAAIVAYYPYMMFVCHSPEYAANYPEHRSRLYIAPYGDLFPRIGIFGFPRRDGWRTLGYLFRSGELAGTYRTNEEPFKVMWYLGQEESEGPFPKRFLIVASRPQRQPGTRDFSVKSEDYRLRCLLRVGERSEVKVYERVAFNMPLLELERDEFREAYRQLCTTGRLIAEYRGPERGRANSSIEGYWLGEFRELSDERARAELRSADFKELRRGLTRVFGQEEFKRRTGTRTADDRASRGEALVFRAGADSPGYLAFGPYRWFPKGSCIARFFLRGERAGDPEATAVELDVASEKGRKVLGRRLVRAGELGSEYGSFDVQFVAGGPREKLEFRVICTGEASVFLDRVEVSVNLDEMLRLGL